MANRQTELRDRYRALVPPRRKAPRGRGIAPGAAARGARGAAPARPPSAP